MKANLRQSMSAPVLDFLIRTAREFRPKGADLLLFGSFAQGRQRANSDLDIAIRWAGPPDPAVRRQIVERLDRAPTIRPIDLVDLQEAGEAVGRPADFAALALADV